ncbi:GLIPR1-like protein 1 [Styela clava]|uniref:GLIPR1-like protein 1 n=1 Tax=Styela clava TaxID=7725 RepID=UPI00193950D2|nr:GLIPR1-like protein 1 [Styela clava]
MKTIPVFVMLMFLCIPSRNSADIGHLKLQRREDTKKHELTTIQKKLIVDKHNELRRVVNPPAADMLYMSWDNDLEKLATSYSRKCIFEHNPDRALEGYNYIGENLHVSKGHGITNEYGANAVISWDNEKHDYTYATRYCTPGKPCGHYTQTAWAKSYKVGCGMTTCDIIDVFGAIWTNAILFTCNYAPGRNSGSQAIYTAGTPCSKCPKYDKCVEKLCTNTTRDSSGSIRMTSANSWKFAFIFTVILQYGIHMFDD